MKAPVLIGFSQLLIASIFTSSLSLMGIAEEVAPVQSAAQTEQSNQRRMPKLDFRLGLVSGSAFTVKNNFSSEVIESSPVYGLEFSAGSIAQKSNNEGLWAYHKLGFGYLAKISSSTGRFKNKFGSDYGESYMMHNLTTAMTYSATDKLYGFLGFIYSSLSFSQISADYNTQGNVGGTIGLGYNVFKKMNLELTYTNNQHDLTFKDEKFASFNVPMASLSINVIF